MTSRGERRLFDSSAAAIFPLPLCAFEKYMFLDDRPDYPMTFALRLKLSGEINRPLFDSSFDEALSRNPLLCAVVEDSGRRGPVWTLAEELKPAVDWAPLGAAVGGPRGEHIDLRSEVGLRAWVRYDAGGADVTLQFHHACCDGGGALRFLGCLLAAYGMRVPPAAGCPTPWPSDPACLVGRARFAADDAARPKSRAGAICTGQRDAARWLGRKPAPLCPDVVSDADISCRVGQAQRGPTTAATNDGGTALRLSHPTLCPDVPESASRGAAIPFLEMFRHVFEEPETNDLLQAAARQGATVNDLLLRDVFLTLREWNAERSSPADDRWLRIAIPIKLKTRDDARMPAANGVSYNFLTRRESWCDASADFCAASAGKTIRPPAIGAAPPFCGGFV